MKNEEQVDEFLKVLKNQLMGYISPEYGPDVQYTDTETGGYMGTDDHIDTAGFRQYQRKRVITITMHGYNKIPG